MRNETKEILESCDIEEKREIIETLMNEIFINHRNLERFYNAVDNQVFGMEQTKNESGFTELGMKQLNNLKKLVYDLK